MFRDHVQCPLCHGSIRFPIDPEELYGKMSASAYAEMLDDIRIAEEQKTVEFKYGATMMADGHLAIRIEAECSECGALWEFEKEDIEYVI